MANKNKTVGKTTTITDNGVTERSEKVYCYNCGKPMNNRNEGHIWYHADQDDLVCTECALKLKHTDTAYAGLYVLEDMTIKIVSQDEHEEKIRPLREVEQEMVKSFNQWDERIKANQQPVAIQDLQYWMVVLRDQIRRTEHGN